MGRQFLEESRKEHRVIGANFAFIRLGKNGPMLGAAGPGLGANDEQPILRSVFVGIAVLMLLTVLLLQTACSGAVRGGFANVATSEPSLPPIVLTPQTPIGDDSREEVPATPASKGADVGNELSHQARVRTVLGWIEFMRQDVMAERVKSGLSATDTEKALKGLGEREIWRKLVFGARPEGSANSDVDPLMMERLLDVLTKASDVDEVRDVDSLLAQCFPVLETDP